VTINCLALCHLVDREGRPVSTMLGNHYLVLCHLIDERADL